MPSWKKVITSGSNASLNSLNALSITGSLLGTASYATQALSSSFASTASFVNTLNQNVLITGGSLTVGATSIGASENTLTLGPRDNGSEGGQLMLQAPGGTYTSASMWDNYANQTRLLRGSNAGSDALVASFNMHTKQMQLPAYNSTGAFPGSAAAFLAVDSSGNLITTSSAGGGGGGVTINNNVDNYVITGTGTLNTLNGESNLQFNGTSLTVTGQITSSGAIISQANGAMYFRGGDDAEFWDINVANTVGIYGQQNQDRAGLKLGSSGATLFGTGSRFGIGTTSPVATLDVNGNLYAASGITGSLFGTASWATNVVGGIGVTSVGTSGTVSGITLTGGTITSTGTITLGGSISGLTTSNLSGTAGITNGQLANSSVTIGSTAISLGGTSTTLAGLTSVISTNFTGSHLGNTVGTASWANNATNATSATTATNATNVSITGDSSGTAFTLPLILGTTGTGQTLYVDSTPAVLYTPSTNQLWAFNLQATGSLFGTASWANNAITASFATQALSASYAPSTPAFPYTGSAKITGSLSVTGSLNVQTYDGANYITAIEVNDNKRNINDILGVSSVNANSRILYDGSSTDSINWDVRRLLSTNTSRSIDWENRFLHDSAGTATVDWANTALYDVGTTYALNWSDREAYDGGEVPAINWDARILIDSSAIIAMRWDLRSAYDTVYSQSIDWSNRLLKIDNGPASYTVNWNTGILRDTNAKNSIDWQNRIAIDTANKDSINWQNRQLKDSNGTEIVNWTSGVSITGSATVSGSLTVTGSLLITGSSTLINQGPTILSGSFKVQGEGDGFGGPITTAITVDDINFTRKLHDSQTGSGSLDFANRDLLDQTGNGAFNWNGGGGTIDSRLYINQTVSAAVRNQLLTNVSTAGQLLKDVAFDSLVQTNDLVYLANDGAWYQVDQTTDSSTRMLGICMEYDPMTYIGKVLLEGDVIVSTGPGYPSVAGAGYGSPVYIKEGAGTAMSTTVPANDYVRLLGYCYHEAGGTEWIMKFRPSNEWYVI